MSAPVIPAASGEDATQRASLVANIHALADFIETRTDLPVPNSVSAQHSVLTRHVPAFEDRVAIVQAAADALGAEVIGTDSLYTKHTIGDYPTSVAYVVHASPAEVTP
jgi:hypothetical protein